MKLTSQVGSLATRVGQGTHVPVDAGLPKGVVEAVEKVEKQGTKSFASGIGPVQVAASLRVLVHVLASDLFLLPGPTASPDDKGQAHEDNVGDASTGRAANLGVVESPAVDDGAQDLRKPVQQTVEGAGAGVEVSAVETVVLIRVKGIGAEEHGEQQEYIGLLGDRVPDAHNLGIPRRVLHQDDLGTVLSNHLVGVGQQERDHGSDEHEHNKGTVRAVTRAIGSLVVDNLRKTDLHRYISC